MSDVQRDASPSVPEVFAVKIPIAKVLLQKGKTAIYDLINRGLLDAIKDGDTTLITIASIRNYQQNLPRAVIRSDLGRDLQQRKTQTTRPQRRLRGKRA